jgi:hypothetical protein
MNIVLRNYSGIQDFRAVSNFLVANYKPDNAEGNWLQPRWEYMHYRTDIVGKIDVRKIGIWEMKEILSG